MEFIMSILGFIWDIFASGAFLLATVTGSVSWSLWKVQTSQLNQEVFLKHKKTGFIFHYFFWVNGLTLFARFIAGG